MLEAPSSLVEVAEEAGAFKSIVAAVVSAVDNVIGDTTLLAGRSVNVLTTVVPKLLKNSG